jgi:PAS domain S-box-containing protein
MRDSKRQGVAQLAAQGPLGQARILDLILRSIPAAIVVTDRQMRALAMSVRWLQAMDLEEGEALGRSLYDIAPALFPRFQDTYARCLAGETAFDPMFHSPRDGGGGECWRTEIFPWRDETGAVGGLVSVSVDITETLEAMRRLEQSEQRLQAAVELADIHVWEVDYARETVLVAGAPESFFDGSLCVADIARDATITIHPEDRALIADEWRRALREDRPYRPEYRINRADGQEVWVACTTRLIRDAGGTAQRLIGAMQNITVRKQAEVTLRRAKEEAQAANAAKSAFLAAMSHEIRTPLNGVLGMAQAMAADHLSVEQAARLATIRESGEALLAILNDVLDLSEIEAGRLELQISDFDLGPILTNLHTTYAAVASDRPLRVTLDLEPSAAGVYRGDALRLRQILSNLLANALKFTEAGEVRLTARRTDHGLCFEVTDTGIGISPGRVSHLFRKFEQADSSTTRRYGGMGLGLAMCQELAALMGGSMEAHSVLGEGSCFRLLAPLPRVGDEAAPPQGDAPDARDSLIGLRVKVLAAEDNPVNRQVLRTLLAQIGIDPVMVENGAEALAAFRREPWDLILMDVQMPTMDGPSATRAIRQAEATSGRRTPVVALTANVVDHQVRSYLAAGMDAVVAKPIRVQDLFAVLDHVIRSGQAPEGRADGGRLSG